MKKNILFFAMMMLLSSICISTFADAFAIDGATDAQWNTWCDNYAKYC